MSFYKAIPTKDGRSRFPEILLHMMYATERSKRSRTKDYDIKETGKVYILPAGTKIYHGSNMIFGETNERSFSNIAWATMNPNIALSYGMKPALDVRIAMQIATFQGNCEFRVDLYELQPTSNLRLFNVNMQNLESLKTEYPELTGIIESIYPIIDGKLGRDSDVRRDWIFANFLCSIGYDGYIANSIGNFHSELMLCKSQLANTRVRSWKSRTFLRWIKELGIFDGVPLEKIWERRNDNYAAQALVFLLFYAQMAVL